MARRRTEVFTLSFLDCICCGFGAVVLFYTIISANSGAVRIIKNNDLTGEVSKLEEEVRVGTKNLVVLRNSLDKTRSETASAMECEVEVYFIGPGVRLLAQGVAQNVVANDSKKTLAVLLDDAKDSGIRLYACTSAWKAHAPGGATLAPQCAGFGGADTYLGRALDPAWRVLTY